MSQRVIISISAKDILLSRAVEDRDLPVPFPRMGRSVPLRDFGGERAAAPDYRIGKAFNANFLELFVDYPGIKENTEIVIEAEANISKEKLEGIRNELIKWGFTNSYPARRDALLCDIFARDFDYKGIVVVFSDGTDLYISTYSPERKDSFARSVFRGLGRDNRTDTVADIIWDQIKNRTLDLHKESQMTALREEAEKFLKSGRSEKNGCIRLSDGQEYDYILSRQELRARSSSEISLDDRFTDLLISQGLGDRTNSILILRGDAIGNRFIEEEMAEAFAKVEEDTGAVAEAADRELLSMTMDKVKTVPTVEKKGVTMAPPPQSSEIEAAYTETEKKKGNDRNDIPPFLPIRISASISKEKRGFLKKVQVLKIHLESMDHFPLPYDSVLCIQERPLTSIEERNVVERFEKGEILDSFFSYDLPLSHLKDTNTLRIYFKPSPTEEIGINNAYDSPPLTIDLSHGEGEYKNF